MLEFSDHEISIDRVYKSVRDPGAGGVVLFLGTVRDATGGREVTRLEYEAYRPMAVKEAARIEEEIRARWNVIKVYAVHRTGRLEIGDVAVIIGVSAAHRAEAFAACKYMIDRIKQDVPIWKKEFFEDGGIWIEGENRQAGMEGYA